MFGQDFFSNYWFQSSLLSPSDRTSPNSSWIHPRVPVGDISRTQLCFDLYLVPVEFTPTNLASDTTNTFAYKQGVVRV
jgi:hypothetical protein